MKFARAFRVRLADCREDASGAAAVEIAMTIGLLLIPLMGAFDIGLYVFQRMQVEGAAQMAVQSAFNTCGQGLYAPPLITSCPGLSAAVNNGAHSTSLGSNVSVTSTTEGDYCIDGTTGQLTTTGCGGTTGHYLKVAVSYSFSPLFRAVPIANLLGATIVRSHYMRMQ
jgi:TadE-like protein